MIHEVDEALRRLLAESGLEASGVEVVLDAPTRDWAARRSAPTVCAFLYDIREDATRRGSGAGRCTTRTDSSWGGAPRPAGST